MGPCVAAAVHGACVLVASSRMVVLRILRCPSK